MKEVIKTVKKGLLVLIIMSFVSSLGGTGLETVKSKLLLLTPLLIILPALNDMTGDFGSIIGSRYTTIIYLGLKNSKKEQF